MINALKSEKKHSYYAFGLDIISDFEMPFSGSEAAPGKAVEVVIEKDRIPSSIPDALKFDDGACRINAQEFLMKTLYVARGKYISYPGVFSMFRLEAKVSLIKTSFMYLMFQRGSLSLHSSAVEIAGKAVLFAGNKGVGKSTMAAHLAQNGYGLLADDSCYISLDYDMRPCLVPGIVNQKLSPEILQELGIDSNGMKANIQGGKYVTDYCFNENKKPLPIEKIIWLEVSSSDKLSIEEVSGFEKILFLMNNVSNMYKIKKAWPEGVFLQKWADIARRIDIVKVTRPLGRLRVDESIIKEIGG